MPNIIACYKYILDDQDIRVDASSRQLQLGRAGQKISDYDRNAIEQGVLIKEEQGGEVIALTAGVPGAKKSLKDALARGADRAVFVSDKSFDKLDPHITAKVLAEAIKKVGNYDLIFCGEGAGDDYSQQVGPRLAVLLGIPVITYASSCRVEDNKVIVERKLENGVEVIEAELPAVVTVTGEINTPRIPSLKQVMSAGKKPQEQLKPADLGLADLASALENVSLLGAVTDRKQVLLKGDSAEAVAELITHLNQEGVL